MHSHMRCDAIRDLVFNCLHVFFSSFHYGPGYFARQELIDQAHRLRREGLLRAYLTSQVLLADRPLLLQALIVDLRDRGIFNFQP